MFSGGKVENDLRAGELARAVYAQLHGAATVGPVGPDRGVEKLDPVAMAEAGRLVHQGDRVGNRGVRGAAIHGNADAFKTKGPAEHFADLIILAAKSEGIG